MWGEPLELWLCHLALSITGVLLVGILAMRLARQPALRRFLGKAAFTACAVLLLASAIPGLPRLPLLPRPHSAIFDLGVLRGDPISPTGKISNPGPTNAPTPSTLPTTSLSWLQCLLMAYLFGASLMALRLFGGLWLMHRLIHHSHVPPDRIRGLWKRLHPEGIVRLRVANRLGQPVVAGFGRLTVLIPQALCETSRADELEAVLLHELAHARARDTHILLVAGLLRIGLYVHPLYWLVWRDLRLSQEMLADAWAARRIGSAAGYAERLVRLAQGPLPLVARLLPVLQAIRRRSEFYQRMDFLLRHGESIHIFLSRRTTVVVSCLVALLTVFGAVVTFGHPRLPETNKSSLNSALHAQHAGIAYLLQQQEDSGGWLTQTGPGVTALTLRALLQNGQPLDSAPVRRALDYIQSTHRQDGGFYVDGQPSYNTAIVLSTLAQIPGDRYRHQIDQGRAFLATLQRPTTTGGFYATTAKPLAIPEFALPEPKPVTDSKKITIRSPGDRTDDAFLTRRNQLTYAQFKSLLYAGLTPDDPRVRAMLFEAQADFSLRSNPLYGQPHGQFYYYYVLSKTLRASGQDTLIDAAGTCHNWRSEIAARLIALQSSDGSWINDQSDYWLENNPVLVTTYCVLSLEELCP
jgi:squalene-hopene/tetraprenyl-beta-curcumene cyclase